MRTDDRPESPDHFDDEAEGPELLGADDPGAEEFDQADDPDDLLIDDDLGELEIAADGIDDEDIDDDNDESDDDEDERELAFLQELGIELDPPDTPLPGRTFGPDPDELPGDEDAAA